MKLADEWKDYEILDLYNGEKVERWGKQLLIRPDPQVIWPKQTEEPWEKRADAHYFRSSAGGGAWEYYKKLPEKWCIRYKDLSFYIKPMGFKHTGLFPEQAVNWDYMISKIKNAGRPIRVLNLFAYTGGATVACLSAGAFVCHVDSSKGMVSWAKENVALSGLSDQPMRFIVDDVRKFVEREIRRKNTYDAIVMDPPSYGRGAGKEVWSLEENLYDLVALCSGVLSENPLFFLINSYTTGLSPTVLENILHTALRKYPGTISSGEIGLPVTGSDLVLPCGIFGRWEEA